jgi:hypothetical protein
MVVRVNDKAALKSSGDKCITLFNKVVAMNNQERDQLSQFLKQLADVRLTEKNAEAEAMIREAAARQPDAVYLLVQRSLLLEQALNEAKTKISELQNQLQQNRSSSTGSFFGNDPWAQIPSKGGPVPGAGNYQIPAATGGANAQFSHAAPQNQNSGAGVGSSFLGNVATTAAGVVAGSFLFQGIENLMGGHHQSGFGQQALNDQQPTEQTVVNNYYGDSDQSDKADNNAIASNDSDSYGGDDNDSFFDGGSDDSGWA